MTRGPAKPIRALGSARMMSPREAKLAATPPMVGWVRTLMYSPPALRKRPRAVDTLAICISEKIPSCIRAPPPEPETITSGSFWRVASSMARVSFSPTTDPMLPMMKLLSVIPRTIRMPLMNPWPTSAASFSPVRACSALTRSG